MIKVVWSDKKNRTNIVKHKVDFNEAKSVFDDPFQITIDDPDHSYNEYRFITFGLSEKKRLLIVIHTYGEDKIRIISARRPTRQERINYEEENFDA